MVFVFAVALLFGYCSTFPGKARAQSWSAETQNYLNDPTSLFPGSATMDSSERWQMEQRIRKELDAGFNDLISPVTEEIRAMLGNPPEFHASGGFSDWGEGYLTFRHTIRDEAETEDRISHAPPPFSTKSARLFELYLTANPVPSEYQIETEDKHYSAHSDELFFDPRYKETDEYKQWMAAKAAAREARLERHRKEGTMSLMAMGHTVHRSKAELISIGGSDKAKVTWDVEARTAFVRWHRGGYVASLEVVAPDIGEVARNHAIDLATRIDALLEQHGFYAFPGNATVAETPSPPEPKVTGSVLSVELLDANPQFSPDGKSLPGDLRPTQLISADTPRKGTTADGVSQLIVRAELSEPVDVVFEIEAVKDDPPELRGSLTPLLDGRTVTLSDRHYAFALYTPPERFDPPAGTATAPNSPLIPPGERLDGGLEIRDLEIWASVEGAEENEYTPLVLGRPPVVLVHGLFADPAQAWVRTFDFGDRAGASMAALLENAGFLPFMVNYQDSNGGETLPFFLQNETLGERQYESWLAGNDVSSHFADNARAVWDSPRVDYTPFRYRSGFLFDEPIYSEQQLPKSARIGGISQALTYYRDTLNLAATQAIVVGHSMGGLLARVWASENYNATYKRPENFGEGDIDRLLTLNTPHHGSELMELKDAIIRGEIEGEDMISIARRQLATIGLLWMLDPEPGAIADLRPGSAALQKIGATKLPVYAIATQYAEAEAGQVENDPDWLYKGIYALAGAAFFNNDPLLDAFIEKRFNDWNAAPDGQKRTTDWNGQGGFDLSRPSSLLRYKQIISEAISDNAYFWAARRSADFQDELRESLRRTLIGQYGISDSAMGYESENVITSIAFLTFNQLVGADVSRAFDDSRESDVPDVFLAILRDLVFHNDPNTDGAVRVESQRGDTQASEVIPNVIHSYATWDYRVQRRVLFLLRGESARFDPDGFEPAGRPLPRYLPSAAFSEARVSGAEAVAWSGMVPAHAKQFLEVAERRNVVVLARPVNPASTRLLACNAAAKGMNVKGKSSNWGPQIGLIPFDQRYSKLSRIIKDPDQLRRSIAEYNLQTVKSTSEEHPEMPGRTYAVKRALQVTSASEGSCDVLTDPDEENTENAVLLLCNDKVFKWQNAQANGKDIFDPAQPLQEVTVPEDAKARLMANPMQVLADDTSPLTPRPYLTADYDLLAIGFPFDAYQCASGLAPGPGDPVDDCRPQPTEGVANSEFDPLRGYISERQMGLLEDLNDAVEENTGYTGGFVTHHGPENQYNKSLYVDYPIVVFDPMDQTVNGDGEIYLIRMGPPGFRDIHLKRLFAQKNREGFNLWPNPDSDGWKWNDRRAFDMVRGYDPRDVANLPPYVEEAPRPSAEAVALVEGLLARAGTTPPAQEEIYFCGSDSSDETDVAQSPAADPDPPATPPDTDQQSELELTFWNDVKDSGSPDELQAFMTAFPDSVFAPLAALRLQALAPEQPLPQPPGDGADVSGTPLPVEQFDFGLADERGGLAWAMTELPNGDFIAVGSASVEETYDTDAWVARIDRSGEAMWQQVWEGPADASITAVASFGNGTTVLAVVEDETEVTRLKLVALAPDGTQLWARNLGGIATSLQFADLVSLSSGDVIAVTGASAAIGGQGHARLLRIGSDGSVLWDRTFPQDGNSFSVAAVELDDGVGALTLIRRPDSDEYASRMLTIDRAGNPVRTLDLSDGGDGFSATDLAKLPGGDLVLLGIRRETEPDTNEDVVIRRLSPGGGLIWERRLDFGASEDTIALALSETGEIAVGSMSEGPDGLFAALTWLDPAGEILASRMLGDMQYVTGVSALGGGAVGVSGARQDGGDERLQLSVWPALKDVPADDLTADHSPWAKSCAALAAGPDSNANRWSGPGDSLADVERSRAVCASALDAFPDHNPTRFFMAQAQARAGDIGNAIELLKMAASADYVPAMGGLGEIYLNNVDGFADPANAIHWLSRAAESGDMRSVENLGVAFLGEYSGIDPDFRLAVDYLTLAANAGRPDAQFHLAQMYFRGQGVDPDMSEALRLYTMASAQGHASATLEIGYAHKYGMGVPENPFESAVYFERAADLGNGTAMFEMGKFYDDGPESIRDDVRAANWYRKAIDHGVVDANSYLGLLYEFGNGVTRDEGKAFELYRRAADGGDAFGMFLLGLMYEDGNSIIKRDTSRAAEYYEEAVELGSGGSMVELAELYRDGDGVEQNDTRAFELFLQAAERDYSRAQSEAGWMLYRGRGVAPDMDEAIRLLDMAAEEREGMALVRLGFIFETEISAYDPPRAAAYYFAALEEGEWFPIDRTRENWDNATAREIQRLLRAAGYYSGPLDGDIGAGSKAAMAKLCDCGRD